MAKSADFSEQPNILYIVTDQQRYDSLSCVGQWICQTPNLDRLAARGVRFDNAYTTCALCTPARASMLSGLLPHNHRLVRNCARGPLRDLPDDVRLISEDLIDAGYNCGYAGKWHCGMQKVPSTYGFVGMDVPNYGNPYGTDEYRNYIESRGLEAPERIQYVEVGREGGGGTLSGPVEACAPHFIAEFTIELMKGFAEDRRQTGKPFMMFTSFWGPHLPCVIPEPYASMYDPGDVELWPNFFDELVGKPRVQARHRTGFGHPLDEADWRHYIAKYWGFCTLIDAEIGRMLDALDALGIGDDTTVMFCSDHGDMSGAHGGFWDKGPMMYEETYHVPMVISGAEVEATGQVCDRLVWNMDLASTVLEIAGATPGDNLDGRSLLPLIKDPNAEWQDDLIAEFHGHRYAYSQRMLRWDHYKYVFNAGDVDELYDLNDDPYEMHNRVVDSTMTAVAQEGRDRLRTWIQNSRDDLSGALPILQNFDPF